MRIIIKAVPGHRQADAEYLQQHLPAAEWCWDETRSHMDTFMRSLTLAGGDACVHMEDDVILTQNFTEQLHQEIATRPDVVIQFFSRRSKDLTEGSRWDNSFIMNQCSYFPPGYSAAIAEHFAAWKAGGHLAKDPNGSDLMIRHWLRSRRERYWIHVPNLVEHRVARSLINSRRSTKRQSLTFTNPL